MEILYFRYSEKSELLAEIRYAKCLDIVLKTKKKVNPATLPTSFRAAFFQSLRVYLLMKTWKKLSKNKKTEITKLEWEVKNAMCYPLMTHMFPGPDSTLKFIRCNSKTGTDAAWGKRYSCQKNLLFCVMVCGLFHGEKCSNKSKSLIMMRTMIVMCLMLLEAFCK